MGSSVQSNSSTVITMVRRPVGDGGQVVGCDPADDLGLGGVELGVELFHQRHAGVGERQVDKPAVGHVDLAAQPAAGF